MFAYAESSFNKSCHAGLKSHACCIRQSRGAEYGALYLNHRFVQANSAIFYDENPAYDNLDAHYTLWRVNHQEAYSKYGVSNNFAESFNAQWRDLQRGVLHKCDNKYLLHYVNEVVWRSDNRRVFMAYKLQDVLQRCLHTKAIKRVDWLLTR